MSSRFASWYSLEVAVIDLTETDAPLFPALEKERRTPTRRHLNSLAELFSMYGVPECIRSDNGPEFIAHAIQQWLFSLEVKTLYVEPGSPWQNGYAESFHSRLRDELLNMEEFDSVDHARAHASAWREDYNGYRPHSSLGQRPPDEFGVLSGLASRPGKDPIFSMPSAKWTNFGEKLKTNPCSRNTWIKNGGSRRCSRSRSHAAYTGIAR